jgi:hypothetical protein
VVLVVLVLLLLALAWLRSRQSVTGGWRSDAWLLYSRGCRHRLMYWSRQILGPAAHDRAVRADAGGGGTVDRGCDHEWDLPEDG